MNYVIDHESKTPAYMQLYYLLRKDIVSGIYPLGTRIPSKRTIAVETGLSVIPVEHALELLCDEGYLEARPRSGMFVIYREADYQGNPSEEGLVLRNPVHSGGDDPTDYLPYSIAAKTMRKVIAEFSDKMQLRSPNQGSDELRHAISTYLGRSRGIQVLPKQIVIGAGSEYLYGLIVQLLGTDRVYGLEDPSYAKIRQVYEAHGVACRMLSMGKRGIHRSQLVETDATVLHVTPFNSYPSGISADVSKKLEYIQWAKERKGYLIEDNYEAELTVSRKEEESVFSLAGEQRVIYLNTFSRTISPSLRIAYMILPLDLVDEFEARLGFYSCTVPMFAQYVLTDLLESGNYERHINRIRRKKRKQMAEENGTENRTKNGVENEYDEV